MVQDLAGFFPSWIQEPGVKNALYHVSLISLPDQDLNHWINIPRIFIKSEFKY
jgi:hypothetical protein